MSDGELTPPVAHGDLSSLLRVSLDLAESLDLDVVLQTAIEGMVEVLGLDTGAIYLLDEHGLYLGGTTPALPTDFPEHLRRAKLADHPHIVRAISTHSPVFMGDARSAELSEAERAVSEIRQLCSVLYVPLILKSRIEGVVIVGTQNEVITEMAESDVDMCRTLSAHVALAISNARLYESSQRAADDLRTAYDATLAGWSRALELRDEETSGHTQRAAALSVELAITLGMPPSEVAHVRRGALLHDIGKMAVPDCILRKAGPLTEAEWEVMRKHPVHAQELLSHIDYLRPALAIPYCHHERWDGSGYPLGLVGEDIPLAARIFAVIDVFDALTSDRPYRDAWSIDRALAHIEANAGSHFDPKVVAAFLERVGPAEI
ncbi:MAG: HD domain-containing phosphohydrolase [Coriobacteriia bacterium]